MATQKHANGAFVSDEMEEIGIRSILIKSIIVNHTSCFLIIFFLYS